VDAAILASVLWIFATLQLAPPSAIASPRTNAWIANRIRIAVIETSFISAYSFLFKNLEISL
jgi:hypothetical protein